MKVLTITKQPHADSVKIGIDWAKTSHHYCLRTLEGTTEFGSFEQDDEQIKQWIEGLSDRFKARRLTICMEDGRSALLHRLQRYETVDLFLVNTTTAARYRTTFTPSGDKNDPGDAASLLDLIERHPEKVRACGKVDSYAQALDQLCRARRAVVDRRTGTIASLREILELYYPLATKLFDEFSTSLALDFLQQWPDLQGLKNAEEATLVNFFHGHRCRSQKRIQERLKEIARYHCPIEEPVLLEVSRSCIIDHTNQIRALNESIQRYEQHIESLFQCHEKATLFSGLPGAAKRLAPRLLAAFCLIDPQDASQMQTQVGIAPIRVQSGQTSKVYMRRFCPKFLRQSFHEFAGCSIKSSVWAKAFYEHQRGTKGHGSHAAKRALAFKWIRILVACWKTGEAYNESEYIDALKRRKSPLTKLIPTDQT